MAKNKHLTDEERLMIEHLLKEQTSLKQIAKKLGKHTSTISQELRARAIPSDKSAPFRVSNRCVKQRDCNKRYLCTDKSNCTRKCSTCKLCNEVCDDYAEQICYKLYEPPYVCNGCVDEFQCTLRKKILHQQESSRGIS
jgi:IS30 family transposase